MCVSEQLVSLLNPCTAVKRNFGTDSFYRVAQDGWQTANRSSQIRTCHLGVMALPLRQTVSPRWCVLNTRDNIPTITLRSTHVTNSYPLQQIGLLLLDSL